MFGNLFRHAHEKQCIKVLDIFGRELDKEFAWQEIRTKIANSIRQESRSIERRIVFDGDRAKDVVGDMIANTCLNDIEFGRDHVYRGVLGMSGQSKRNIFASVVSQQFADGWISPQELGTANENMKKAVAGGG